MRWVLLAPPNFQMKRLRPRNKWLASEQKSRLEARVPGKRTGENKFFLCEFLNVTFEV